MKLIILVCENDLFLIESSILVWDLF